MSDDEPGQGDQEARSAPMRELQRLSSELRRFVEDAVVDGDAQRDDLRLVGVGPEGIRQGFDRLERRTRVSAWNMQRSLPFDPSDPGKELDARSRRRGLDLRLMTAPIAKRLNPLLPCLYPDVRTGPVPIPMMLLDGSAVVLPGPNSAQGEWSVWLATNADVVTGARELWTRTWAVSVPWTESGEPPLTPRQYAVACHLAIGMKDDAIARQLKVSRRTVVADVEAILAFVGARSRFEAGAMIRGAYD